MTRLSTDATGFTPDTSDADAVTAYRERYPDAAEIEVIRTGGGVMVGPKQEVQNERRGA